MSPVTIGIIGIFLLFLLLASRMHIGFSMAVVGFLGFAVLNALSPSFSILGMEPFKIGAQYSLTVIPLFILMGQFANYSKMGFEIYQTVYRWIGFLPGGLSMATVGACGGFAAISGSSLAAAATMGMVALPVPSDGKSLVAGLPLLPSSPPRADVLVFVESKGKTTQPPHVTRTGRPEAEMYRGRY